MQKRFWIKNFKDVRDAYSAKKSLQVENPDKVYQIRRGTDGANIIFRLVERLTTSEAKVVINEHSKRRNKRKYRPAKSV